LFERGSKRLTLELVLKMVGGVSDITTDFRQTYARAEDAFLILAVRARPSR
jgi:hypothetical protein